MREIRVQDIQAAIVTALKDIHYHIRPDLAAALKTAINQEASPLGRQALELLLQNATMASAGILPLCQDTGMVILFMELGQEVLLVGGDLHQAIQAAVREAAQVARLRHSMCNHPLHRKNTGDNTPAEINIAIVPGSQVRLQILSKGSGSENASRLAMLLPSAGVQGIEEFALQTIRNNAAAACPPIIVGIGVGGSFDSVGLLAKKALLRNLGAGSPDPDLAKLEKQLLGKINQLGLGPQGWGGSTTALSVAIESAPCHIASLPVAVNIECHSHRMAEVVL